MTSRQRATDGLSATKRPKQGQGSLTAPKPRKSPPALIWAEATATPIPDGWRFTLPVIASANRLWRSGRGRTYKAQGAKDDVTAARLRFPCVLQRGALTVKLAWYRQKRTGDTDNRIKPVLDLLKGIAYADDASICRIEAERFDDGSPARMVVDITPHRHAA